MELPPRSNETKKCVFPTRNFDENIFSNWSQTSLEENWNSNQGRK